MKRITRKSSSVVGLIGLAALSWALPPAVAADEIPPLTIHSSANPADVLELDLAKLRAHGRIVYVSSGELAFASRMIDSDVRTAFRFANSDLAPTVIVELAHTEKIHRVTTAFPAEATRLDVYVASQLPRDLSNFRFFDPVGSITEFDGSGKGMVDFSPREVRYVVLRWARQKHRGEFKVTEVSAFGGGSLAFLDMDVPMPVPAEVVSILPRVPPVSPE